MQEQMQQQARSVFQNFPFSGAPAPGASGSGGSGEPGKK
jgi:hypothetical protein